MNVQTEVERIAARVKAAGFSVAELLRKAEVDTSQWQRWKAGKQTPLATTWSKVTSAADDLAPPTHANAE